MLCPQVLWPVCTSSICIPVRNFKKQGNIPTPHGFPLGVDTITNFTDISSRKASFSTAARTMFGNTAWLGTRRKRVEPRGSMLPWSPCPWICAMLTGLRDMLW